MITIGLTGGIGMGKSTVAGMFRRLGMPVFDADATVRALQAPGGAALPALQAAFQGIVRNGVLQRDFLRAIVLGDPHEMRRLEAVMHPLVRHAETKFRAAARRASRRAILLDIPLLFETRADRRMDISITVSAPRDVQVARVRKRGLPRAQIDAIIARQMPDREKCRRADYVIRTGLSKFQTFRRVKHIMKILLR